MNNGVYALPGFMAPAAKNWKSQLLTNEDGSVKLCVYVGKPGTKVYYSLGIPGWKWGFIKDAQYFIDKGYPQEVIDEVSKFADYLDEEVTELPEGTVVPDIVINGWPVPITESPIEGKVYWILNIPKFILPAGDTEVQISANGKLIKYTITRPDFSIHYNTPGYTISTGTSGGGSGGSSTGGLTSEERATLAGAAQRGGDNTFTASNTFTGEVDMSGAQVTPPDGWNVEGGAELTAEAIQATAPLKWGDGVDATGAATAPLSLTFGSAFSDTAGSYTCTTEGQGSITIGAGANTLGEGSTNSITIGCKAKGSSSDCIVIGAGAGSDSGEGGSVIIGAGAKGNWGNLNVIIGKQATVGNIENTAIGFSAKVYEREGVSVGSRSSCAGQYCIALGTRASSGSGSAHQAIAIGYGAVAAGGKSTAIGLNAKSADRGATVIRSTAEDGTYTQLYFSGANTPLANTYEGGEAMMGYVVRDSAGNVMVDAEGNAMVGTQKLSVLFPNNRGENAFTPAMLGLDDEYTPKPMFRPSDLDLPTEEPSEPEEYTPLPVYPIVEPEIKDINLINAE